MTMTLFVLSEAALPADAVSDPDAERTAALVAALPGLREALLYRPVLDALDHPFAADGRGPALVLELGFGTAAEAEAALTPGQLGRLAVASGLPGGTRFSHQAMAARHFPVDDPAFRPAPDRRAPCTFLVSYPGPAADPERWLDHYDANHPPIMRRFPGVRQVATYRPVPALRSGLDWDRASAMQRNKVAFDSPAALAAALSSPVMQEMRADTAGFPPFEGKTTHYPMWTRVIR